MSQALLIEKRGGVAVVTLNRPEVRNAFDDALIAALAANFKALDDDDDVRAVVLGGNGPAFCAGADLSGMAAGAGYVELHDARGELAHLFRDLYALGKPTVARVRGYALAGGFPGDRVRGSRRPDPAPVPQHQQPHDETHQQQHPRDDRDAGPGGLAGQGGIHGVHRGPGRPRPPPAGASGGCAPPTG